MIRTVRHSTRGVAKVEGIQDFITSWSYVNAKKNADSKSILDDTSMSNVEEIKHGK